MKAIERPAGRLTVFIMITNIIKAKTKYFMQYTE
jgi:hypothetical protein